MATIPPFSIYMTGKDILNNIQGKVKIDSSIDTKLLLSQMNQTKDELVSYITREIVSQQFFSQKNEYDITSSTVGSSNLRTFNLPGKVIKIIAFSYIHEGKGVPLTPVDSTSIDESKLYTEEDIAAHFDNNYLLEGDKFIVLTKNSLTPGDRIILKYVGHIGAIESAHIEDESSDLTVHLPELPRACHVALVSGTLAKMMYEEGRTMKDTIWTALVSEYERDKQDVVDELSGRDVKSKFQINKKALQVRSIF